MTAADAQHRQLQLRAVTAAITFALTLVLLKGLAFVQSGSVALLSSLVDSLLDGLASGVNLLAIRYAMSPADSEHRFGHGKAEPLAALLQAGFITGSGLFVLLEALRRLKQDHAPVDAPELGIAVMVLGMVGTSVLVLYQRRIARQTGSLVVHADSLHYLSDVLAHFCVLLALLIASQPRWWWVDPLAALLIAGYVLHSAWQVGRRALDQLMDRELDDELRAKIHATAVGHPRVHGVHDLKTRAAGTHRFIQMHIELDAGLTLEAAHAISDAVAERTRTVCPGAQIIIHQDPIPCARDRAGWRAEPDRLP